MLLNKNLLSSSLIAFMLLLSINAVKAEETKYTPELMRSLVENQMMSMVENGTRANLSPPVAADEPVLFVDLNCKACQAMIKEIYEKNEFRDLKLAIVMAIPPEDTTLRNVLWHFSESEKFGKSDLGCKSDCSTIRTALKAPATWNALAGNDLETLKRIILLGQNIKTLNVINKKHGEISRVPALLTGLDTVTVIESYEQISDLLSGSQNE